MKTLLRVISIIFLLIGGFGLFLVGQNSDKLIVSSYEYFSQRLPESFDNFKIVQLSDMHNHSNQYSNGNIITMVKSENPDIVVMTGDFVDTHTKNIDEINFLLDGLNDYPIYFVPGNHEAYSPMTDQFYQSFFSHDKNVRLFDSLYIYKIGGDSINLFGLHDPYYDHPDNQYFFRNEGNIDNSLSNLVNNADMSKFSILLSHRPELIDIYAKYDLDVVFSGHTHGGQISFGWTPYAANQCLPTYVAGEYVVNSTTMYVSRGLGYSAFLPVRMNCDMEIIATTLRCA